MEDPTIEKLRAMGKEVLTHKERLNQKAREVRRLGEVEQNPDKKELLLLLADAFSEQVDTGLDFQAEFMETIIEDIERSSAALPPDEGAEEDEAFGLALEENEILMKALMGYRALLDSYEKAVTDDATRAHLVQCKKDCTAAIELVEEITVADDDDDDGDDEADGEADGEEEAPTAAPS